MVVDSIDWTKYGGITPNASAPDANGWIDWTKYGCKKPAPQTPATGDPLAPATLGSDGSQTLVGKSVRGALHTVGNALDVPLAYGEAALNDLDVNLGEPIKWSHRHRVSNDPPYRRDCQGCGK